MVGYYHADARMQPPAELPPAGKKVADKLGAKLPAAFMLLLDAKRLAQFSAGGEACQPFELVTKDGSRGWRRDPTATISLAQGSWKDLQVGAGSSREGAGPPHASTREGRGARGGAGRAAGCSCVRAQQPACLHHCCCCCCPCLLVRAWAATLTAQRLARAPQAEFLTLYKRGRFALLVDFDDHLDDLQKDWLNPDIVGKFALPGQL